MMAERIQGRLEPSEDKPAGAPNGQVNLWILDDDQPMCQLLAHQCGRVGWLLQSFHHPRQLPQALEAGEPDLLVLDQLLPEKHGIDVLTSLRQQGQTFPVVILSALGASSDRIAGLEAGADDYLSKPFQFRELQLRIDRLLRTPRLASEPQPIRLPQSVSFQIGTLRFEVAQQRLLTTGGESHRLSRGDCALLAAFCRRPGEVLSRAHLLQSTGSLVTPGQSRTIDVRLSRLRRLFRQLEGVELIAPERGQGYRLIAEVNPLAAEESPL